MSLDVFCLKVWKWNVMPFISKFVLLFYAKLGHWSWKFSVMWFVGFQIISCAFDVVDILNQLKFDSKWQICTKAIHSSKIRNTMARRFGTPKEQFLHETTKDLLCVICVFFTTPSLHIFCIIMYEYYDDSWINFDLK